MRPFGRFHPANTPRWPPRFCDRSTSAAGASRKGLVPGAFDPSVVWLTHVALTNNTFMLSAQTRALSAKTPVTLGNEDIVARLCGQLASITKALDRMIGRDGFACLGRVTLADCALVPALFCLENVLPRTGTGIADPIAANANLTAYWAAIQREEHAARILVELHRGLQERLELIRSGAIETLRAAPQAAREAAERAPSA